MRVLQIQSYNFYYQEPMYQFQQGSPMNNYSDINPYIMIYYSMNIRIHEDITREAAENVVKQIGYMHNAIGHVFKDLSKILSYKFPQNPPQQQHQPVYQHRKESIYSKNSKNDYPKPMEIQENQVESKPVFRPKVIEKQIFAYEKPIEENKNMERFEKRNHQQMIEIRNNDIFGQFAYGRQQEEGKNGSKKIDIKSSIAKIVEEKVNKKKKEGKKGQSNDKKKSNSSKQKQQNIQKPRYQPQNPRQFNSSKHNELKSLLNSHTIPNLQENDIFSEFQYERLNNSPDKPQENYVQIIQENIQQPEPQQQPQKHDEMEPQNNISQNQSSYWNYYKQKPEPDIYEISDDD